MEPQQFSWVQVQRSLQQQYILTQSEAEQKNTFEKKLNSSLISFHTSFIQYIQSMDSNNKTGRKKKILKDDGFGNAYTFIKEVILTLSKDYRIIAEIVRKNDQQWNQKWVPISKLIVNNLFEDIVEEQINHKDIMYLMRQILEILIKDESDPSKVKFGGETVSAHILKDFTQRADIKKYSQMILKPTLLAISKVECLLDLDAPENNSTSNTKVKPGKEQRHVVHYDDNPYKEFTRQFTQNWTKKYSLILKQYDKTKGHSKTEQPDCYYVSKHLLYFLGVSDQASIPTFDLIKPQQKLQPFTSQIYLNRSESSSYKSEQLSDSLSMIRNIICCFFGQIFKYIYNMPTTIRLVCKLIEQTLLQKNKYMKRSEILSCVSNFIFKTWLLPELKFHDKVLAIGLINTITEKNVQFIQEMIGRIVNGVEAIKDRPYKAEINSIVSRLKQSVDNYLEEILKCDADKVKNLVSKTKEQRIRSYSICLNYKQMKILFEMILNTQQCVALINQTIVNRTNRIKDMTDNFDIFKGKQDKDDDGSLDYVLFSQLALPKHLQSDYYKTYIETYKNDKPKNLLRKILISLDPTDIHLLKRNSIDKFLTNLQKSSKFKQDFVGFDKVPMNIKVRYLLSLKIADYNTIGRQMIKELAERKPISQNLYNQTKNQFLRASDSVRRYNEKVSEEQMKLNVTNKLSKLNDFIRKATINRCISSPKSRENHSAYKTFLIKNPNVADKDKIWSHDPKNCYHTSANLQFVTSLTGEGDKDAKEYHFNDINKYLDAFSSLPEVKICVFTGEDKVGIRSIFFDFIRDIISMIKTDPKGNSILLEEENWLSENLQKIMTRRIYERIYPRHMTYNDTALYFRLKTLQWILPQHLHIVYNMQTDPLWKIASSTLNQIDNFKTPSQKMQCIVACSQNMNHILKLTMDKNDTANADTTTPLMQYIILKAAPRRLYSNLNFISIFYQSNKMMSGAGYAFTQLQIGVNFLQILNEQNLQISKLMYEKNIYDKQIEYGMYFLQKRPRAQKQPFDEGKFKDLYNTYLRN